MHCHHDADQSALLFATNVAAIVATGTLVFLGYRVRDAARSPTAGRRRAPPVAPWSAHPSTEPGGDHDYAGTS
ncbi:hypothetical protein GCM10017667_79640 [Streptomyces filamentosus]|uniref:Uncharacterized protein n=1 Tax=Streptomyces filamentosus TaxID=67294 RepID=A0A919EUA6_STRFL|nr:hypothetical protein GCM10017667_79640 [Streptomyces filamentosus]